MAASVDRRASTAVSCLEATGEDLVQEPADGLVYLGGDGRRVLVDCLAREAVASDWRAGVVDLLGEDHPGPTLEGKEAAFAGLDRVGLDAAAFLDHSGQALELDARLDHPLGLPGADQRGQGLEPLCLLPPNRPAEAAPRADVGVD